jgi:stearoyl-CoA desaturase (delta-9 desaturase)
MEESGINSKPTDGPGQDTFMTWLTFLPFGALHLACLGVIWVGWSWIAVAVALLMYWIRMFAVTGFYHRYLSHGTYKTSRWFQFLLALIGSAATQKGPLWWAAHHRHHHKYADMEQDIHSPTQRGFFYSHVGWIFDPKHARTKIDLVPDLIKFPELRFLNRFELLVPILLAVALFGLGTILERYDPSLGTNGWQMLVWGFFISTVALAHSTFTINSLSHVYGRRRYQTRDTSRNNIFLALLTMGEGWHNNHHRYGASTRQGFYWWELDLTYYGLFLLSKLGFIRDLTPVPERILAEGRLRNKAAA